MITSAEEFIKLRTSEIPEEYHRSAHEGAADEVWLTLINDYPDMLKWVAHNKTISDEIIRELFKTNDLEVKYVLAQKRKTPQDVLAQLCKDLDEGIRLRVALHPKLSDELYSVLENDEWEQVRDAIKERRRKSN